LIDAARQRVAQTVNAELTQLYWQIGRRIGTELLHGQRADYGKQVMAELARQLTADFGKGWSERQLRYCVRVAEVLPDAEILHTPCAQISNRWLEKLAGASSLFFWLGARCPFPQEQILSTLRRELTWSHLNP